MPTAIALLSGGMDSTVSLVIALKRGIRVKQTITFDYGQKSARQEIKSAGIISRKYHIKHQVFDIRWLGRLAPNPLTSKDKPVPEPASGKPISRQTSYQVWIPNRNALFINIAAAIAEVKRYQYIITGFNREEARNFPDNSIDFIRSVNKMLSYSTLNKVRVVSFTSGMDKRQIVNKASVLKIPLEYTWSCYLGGRKPCGRCESCLRRLATD